MDRPPWEHLRNYCGFGEIRRFFDEVRSGTSDRGRSRREKPNAPKNRKDDIF
jgi:hypothetical protein